MATLFATGKASAGSLTDQTQSLTPDTHIPEDLDRDGSVCEIY